jgi:hypothetical protein
MKGYRYLGGVENGWLETCGEGMENRNPLTWEFQGLFYLPVQLRTRGVGGRCRKLSSPKRA